MKTASGFTLNPHTFPYAYATVVDESETQVTILPPAGTLLEDFLDGIAEGRLVHRGAVVTFEKAWLHVIGNEATLHGVAFARIFTKEEQYFRQKYEYLQPKPGEDNNTERLRPRTEMLRLWGSFVESQERRIRAERECSNAEEEPTSTIYIPELDPFVGATFTNPQTKETERVWLEERTSLEEWLASFPTGYLTLGDGNGGEIYFDLVRPLARAELVKEYRESVAFHHGKGFMKREVCGLDIDDDDGRYEDLSEPF